MRILVGWIAVGFGILWILWPQLLRGWAVGKASRAIFWPLFFAYFFPLAAWAHPWGLNGWIAALVLFFIFGNLLRAALNRAAGKVPLWGFRAAGALNLVSGICLVFLPK